MAMTLPLNTAISPTKRTVVMVAMIDENETNAGTIQSGTRAYLLPSADPEVLLSVIAQMDLGHLPHADSLARAVTLHVEPEVTAPQHAALSHREKDVLRELVQGLSYKMIAAKLGISFETVRTHIKNIYTKLSVNNNTEAVAKTLNGRLLA